MADVRNQAGDMQNSDATITVLVAAYNGEAYIGEQLDSILAQSQGGIRILVSDDCSRDRTPEILKAYAARYPEQVAVICREKPSGGAAAHFLGLLQEMERGGAGAAEPFGGAPGNLGSTGSPGTAKSRGGGASFGAPGLLACLPHSDYFMLSDQDDVWLPGKAEKLLARMRELERERGADTPVLVHSDLAVVDEKLRVLAHSFFKYQKITPGRTKLPQLLVQNNVTGGAVMLNRAFLPLLGTLPQVCLMHDAWLALLAGCFGVIGWVNEPLYLYRQHGKNTLGAEKGDNLEGVERRLKDGSEARENYRKMFGQAASLLELYPDRLSGEQKEILRAFTGIPRLGRLGRMRTILRYGFTKNTFLRTLGQMLMIGD